MKTIFPLMCALGLLMTGCAGKPLPKRYSVFSAGSSAASAESVTSPYSGLKVRMAEDLRAHAVPLRFHANGEVSAYRALTYYAPLEVALTRALEDCTAFQRTRPEVLAIEVRDYCLVEHPDGATSALEVRVTLQARPVGAPEPPRRCTRSRTLPTDASPSIVRQAFAETLLEAYAALQH